MCVDQALAAVIAGAGAAGLAAVIALPKEGPSVAVRAAIEARLAKWPVMRDVTGCLACTSVWVGAIVAPAAWLAGVGLWSGFVPGFAYLAGLRVRKWLV